MPGLPRRLKDAKEKKLMFSWERAIAPSNPRCLITRPHRSDHGFRSFAILCDSAMRSRLGPIHSINRMCLDSPYTHPTLIRGSATFLQRVYSMAARGSEPWVCPWRSQTDDRHGELLSPSLDHDRRHSRRGHPPLYVRYIPPFLAIQIYTRSKSISSEISVRSDEALWPHTLG